MGSQANNSGVTILSLGAIGAAVGKVLLQKSKELRITVWNCTASRLGVQKLAQAGAIFEPDVSKAIASSRIMIFLILTYDTTDKLLAQLKDTNADSVLQGKTVVILTTGTPRQEREKHNQFRSLHVKEYFDGGMTIPPDQTEAGHAFFFISGDESQEFFRTNKAQELVSMIGKPKFMGSESGVASLHDLALLSSMYGMFAGDY